MKKQRIRIGWQQKNRCIGTFIIGVVFLHPVFVSPFVMYLDVWFKGGAVSGVAVWACVCV